MGKPKSPVRIAVIAAESDAAARDEAVAAVTKAGGSVATGAAEDSVIGVAPSKATLVVVSPALVLTPWLWNSFPALEQSGGPLVGWLSAPTLRGGNPLGRLAVVSSQEALAAWLSGATPDAEPAPDPAPAYTSEASRLAGEHLAAGIALHRRDPDRWPDALEQSRGARRRPAPGEFFGEGRWRLLERQAPGVWSAWDTERSTRVALDFEPEALAANEASVERFVSRIERIRALIGPGVLSIHAVGVEGEQAYVVRDWRPRSLRDPRERTTWEILQILLDTATALAPLHRAREPHGRLEPGAVWVDLADEASVSSFGAIDSSTERRHSLFDAPESLGLSWEPDPRADVFSLGMILLQLLHNSELPFWVLRDPERLVAGLDVPPMVKEVIRRATEWDLDRRLPDADAVLAAFQSDADLLLGLADALEASRPRAAASHLAHLAATVGGEALHARLGRLMLRNGDTRGALDHLGRALALTGTPEAILAEIRPLTEATGNPGALAELLAAEAARRPLATRIALWTELAALQERALGQADAASATWGMILADHHSPEVARNALENLARLARQAGDFDATISYTRDLLPYLPAAERPERQAAIGALYLVELHDELNALLWLDRAEAGGYVSIDLARHLEEIRARKGQWVQAIVLMRRQAEFQPAPVAGATLVRAAGLARAVHLGDAATEIFEQALISDPAQPAALRALARVRSRAGRAAEALELLGRLVHSTQAERADRVDYARALLEAGRPAEARPWVEGVLEAEPHQVPALRMAARIALYDGDLERADAATSRLAHLLEGGPEQVEPVLWRAELAWYRGDLDGAHAGYHRVVELDPGSVAAWWGLAKVSLAAAGEPRRAEKSPWLRALPARFTAQEALARLLAGVLDVDALDAWTQQWPLGRAVRAGGRWPTRLAACAVDLLHQAGAVPDLIRRFSVAWPEWARALEWVGAAWGETREPTDAFPIQRSYRWSAAWLEESPDADANRARSILPHPGPAPAPLLRAEHEDPLSILLSGPRPASPDGEALPPDPPTEIYVGPARVPALMRGNQVLAALLRGQETVELGSDPTCDVVVSELAPRHARLFRSGPFVYLVPLDGAVSNTAASEGSRLFGGETMYLGHVPTTFRWFERDEDLPAAQELDPLTDPQVPPAPRSAIPLATPHKPPPPDPGDAGEYDEVPAYALPRLRHDRPAWAPDAPPAENSSFRLILSPTDEPQPPGLLETNPGPLTGIEPSPKRLTPRPSTPPQSGPAPRIAKPARPTPTGPKFRGAVEVMSGPERGYTRFVHGEITVGRGREAAIHIASDTQLSRIHCRVVERSSAYFLIDNGSTRGTVVNGKKISEVELKGGEVIMAGRTVFSFKLVEEETDLSDDATDMQESP